MDFMPYEGAPVEGEHDFKRLALALAIAAGIVAGAWLLGAFAPVSPASPSEFRSASSARQVDSATANRGVASPAQAKHSVAPH
jgi:hypothetical protein